MEKNKFWYLKQVDLFHGISDNEMLSIATRCVGLKLKEKELIYTPFKTSNSIFFLKKGEVTLYYSHYGKKLIIDTLGPGAMFGNLDPDKEKADHFAEVTEDCYLCALDYEDFMKMIQTHPELMLRLIKLMSERISDCENKLKTGLFDAKEKIIYQLELLEKRKTRSLLHSLRRLPGKITHEKLAQYTGLSRETVSRAIQDLKKAGVIKIKSDGTLGLVK